MSDDATALTSSREYSDAFLIVFETHFEAILHFFRRRVDRETAEDLAAETLAQAFASRFSFDIRRGSVRAWLFGIATNLLRNHYRTEERLLRAYAETGRDPLIAEDAPGVDGNSDGARVAEALAKLSPADREVILLFAWVELSYEEIAEALSIPIGTVRSRLNRARRIVRDALIETGQYRQGAANG